MHINAYIHTHIHKLQDKNMFTCVYKHSLNTQTDCTHMQIQKATCSYMCARAHTHTHTHTQLHTDTSSAVNSPKHTANGAYIQTHTYKHNNLNSNF